MTFKSRIKSILHAKYLYSPKVSQYKYPLFLRGTGEGFIPLQRILHFVIVKSDLMYKNLFLVSQVSGMEGE